MTQDLIVTETQGWVAIPLGATAFSLNSDGRAFYGQAASAGDLAGVNGARMVSYVPYLIDASEQYFVRAVGSTAILSLEV
ncbi:MAG TPA: hypothetical protein CFH81_08855 [Sulfurovum sp. UBA12169]|nr:MAG TPA: hypothetical protein CFH81_08855 [Sulfurovum sp. UBA12169]